MDCAFALDDDDDGQAPPRVLDEDCSRALDDDDDDEQAQQAPQRAGDAAQGFAYAVELSPLSPYVVALPWFNLQSRGL
jgi:hypothetical protein